MNIKSNSVSLSVLSICVVFLGLGAFAPIESVGDTDKVEICHFPPGYPANFHTITISENLLNLHLENHGDVLGKCCSLDNLCDDGDACTANFCMSEECTAEPVDCDDQVACTVESCDFIDGCSNTPDDSLCAEGEICDAELGCVSPEVDPTATVREPGHAPPSHITNVMPAGESSPAMVNMNAVPGDYFTKTSDKTTQRQQTGTQLTTSTTGIFAAPADLLAGTQQCSAVDTSQAAPACRCSDNNFNIIPTPGVYCSCTDSNGIEVPSPDSCNDMLQGRRVLGAFDDLLISTPENNDDGTWRFKDWLFHSRPDSDNPDLGDFHRNANDTWTHNVDCEPSSGPMPQKSKLGRPYNTPHDFIMALELVTNLDDECVPFAGPGTGPVFYFKVRDPKTGTHTVSSSVRGSAEWAQTVVGDFNLDGFDDILLLTTLNAKVFSAFDTSDPSQGLQGHRHTLTGNAMAAINEPTSGDFNGDGLLDIAWVGGDFRHGNGSATIFFATVCPRSIPGSLLCDGAEPFDIILDPAAKLFPDVPNATSNWVLKNASYDSNICSGKMVSGLEAVKSSYRASGLTMGNFDADSFGDTGRVNDELIVAYVSGSEGQNSDHCEMNVLYLSYAAPEVNGPTNDGNHPWMRNAGFKSNLFPEFSAPGHVGENTVSAFTIHATTARLNWFGESEQAVLGLAGTFSKSGSLLNSFPAILPTTVWVEEGGLGVCAGVLEEDKAVDTKHYRWLFGTQPGRFTTTMPPDGSSVCGTFPTNKAGKCPFNPQIAMLHGALRANTSDNVHFAEVRLYNVVQSKPDGDETEYCSNHKSLETPFFPAWTRETHDLDDIKWIDWDAFSTGNLLHVGDPRGKSIRVGEPLIVRMTSHTGVDIVLQSPPMHIDYAKPEQSVGPAGDATVLNLTNHPSFWTQYTDGTSTGQGATKQNSNSYTTSNTESLEEKFSLTIAEIATTISGDLKQTLSQVHEHSTSKQTGVYQTKRFSLQATTQFDDIVHFTQQSFSAYHYPLLGMETCPVQIVCDGSDSTKIDCMTRSTALKTVTLACEETADKLGCECTGPNEPAVSCPSLPVDPSTRDCSTDGNGNACCALQKLPLNYVVSGPKTLTSTWSAGGMLEWYQPPHMPNQLFSYPRGVDRALARYPRLEPLAGGHDDAFSTSTGSALQTASWTCTLEDSASISDNKTFSYDLQNSLSVGTPKAIKDATGSSASITARYDHAHSSSHGSLKTSSFTHTSSSGLATNIETSNFLFAGSSTYVYEVTPLIIGAEPPPGVLDNKPNKVCDPVDTECISGQTKPNKAASCSTTGPLRMSYAADINAEAGWWGNNYGDVGDDGGIDLALNHPRRWVEVPGDMGVDDTDFQCRGDIGDEFCFVAHSPSPPGSPLGDVWANDYYAMRGLFITVGGLTGNQRTTAGINDQIFLQARVHNFSFVSLNDKVLPYVQFYAQQINPSFDADHNILGHTYIGTGVPIGDKVEALPSTYTPPLSGWSVHKDNFAMATTSFKPSSEAFPENSYWIFWVVVWPENEDGSLAMERPGHGLANSFDPAVIYPYITDVPLETVQVNGNTRIYSNNVGLFKQVFAIVGDDPVPDALSPSTARLEVGPIFVTPEFPRPRGRAEVFSHVRSHGAATPGMSVHLSEGDPDNGGRIFDVEQLAHIYGDDDHIVHVSYSPSRCGTHDISVEVFAGGGLNHESHTSVVVPCEPALRKVNGQGRKLGSLKASMSISATLEDDAPIDLRNVELTVESLLDELGEGGELVRSLAERSEPLTLVASHGASQNSAWFARPKGEKPLNWLHLRRRNGEILLDVDLSFELIDRPIACGGNPARTELQTSLLLDDGHNPPLRLVFDPRWECDKGGDRVWLR